MTMTITEHANGDLTVPRTAEIEAEGILGDGEERITAEHPEYVSWRDDIERGVVVVMRA